MLKTNNTDTNNNQLIISMNEIKEAIINHLNMDTQGALMITGYWGAGKTYYFKNVLFPELEKNEKIEYTPIMVSLFGEKDTQKISNKILHAIIDRKGEAINLKTSKVVGYLGKLTKAVPYLKRFVDSGEVINLLSGGVFDLIKTYKILLFLDDFERLGKGLKQDEFLGYINDLSENKGCKVIVIANEEEINKKNFKYKEKTIARTIYFLPNPEEVYSNIIESYKEHEELYKFLEKEKDFFLRTLDPSFDFHKESLSDKYNDELTKSLSNVRILKSVLEHFKIVFNIIDKEKDISKDHVKAQIFNVWCFILSFTIESKSPGGPSYNDTKQLDEISQFYIDVDLLVDPYGFKKNDSSQEEEQEEDYSEKFKNKYYHRIAQTYYFYPDIYNFIIAGRNVIPSNFIKDLDDKFKIKDNEISSAHEVYTEFMSYGRSTFSNEMFPVKLKSLLKFVEAGEYSDYLDYVNCSVYLLGFADYFSENKSLEEIKEAIKTGIRKIYDKIKYDTGYKSTFGFRTDHEKDPNVIEVIEFINEELDRKEQEARGKEAAHLEELLIDKPNEVFNAFYGNESSSIFSVNDPLFILFDLEKIITNIKNWEAEDVLSFSSFMEKRYSQQHSLGYLQDEFDAVCQLVNEIAEMNTEDKLYSNYYIEKTLKPVMEKVKTKIEGYRNRE